MSLMLAPPEVTQDEAADPPGIEFAPPPTLDPSALPVEVPPPTRAEAPLEGPSPPPAEEVSLWPDPGTAPPNGTGVLVTAAVMSSVGVLVPLALLQTKNLSNVDRDGIIATGASMQVIALLGFGLGVARRVKWVRWANAYRVQPTSQGGGLLAMGGIALSAGTTLAPLGLWIMGRGGDVQVGTAMVIGGVAALGLAPLGLVFGKRRRDAYLASGGWTRPPLPPVTFAPRLLVLPGGFGLSVSGRF